MLFAVLLIGCSGPTEKSVTSDFLKRNPNATVISAIPGEGDFSVVYYKIKFRTTHDPMVKTETWQYQRNPDTKEWSFSRSFGQLEKEQ